jgi:hypothetical protein
LLRASAYWVTKEWVSLSIPDRTPEGKQLTLEEREDILSFCVDHYAELLRECPCLQSEDVLAQYRIEDIGRKPEPADAIDIMHMAPALAYCNAAVTHDGYVADQGRRYMREHGKRAFVGRLLSEVVNEVIKP